LQTKVLAFLRGHGGYWLNISPGPFSRSGVPDILGCYKGQFYGIELKQTGKYKPPEKGLTAAQRRASEEILKAGGRYLCADNLDAVRAFVNGGQ
jgi:hypothetical protein